MDSNNTSMEGGAKKVPLEDLNRDELLKKCRSLLAIAQRAKQAKDTLTEENNKLKDKLSNPVTNELIENLTQQKLSLVTDLEELKNQRKLLDEKLSNCEDQLFKSENVIAELDTENVSYKRQINRLTDENEQLITHLDSLEKQIEELKRLGLEQQQQLLELEKNNTVLSENVGGSTESNKEITELQNMLTVSLEEVKKLKTENLELHNKLENSSSELNEKQNTIAELTNEIEEKTKLAKDLETEIQQHKETNNDTATLNDKIESLKTIINESAESIQVYQQEIEVKTKEIEKHTSLADDLNTEIHRNRALIEKLKQDITNMSSKLSNSQIMSSGLTTDLENTNEKLKEKLKFYHSKIVKFAGDVTKLKESKEYILNNFKTYNKQVNLWKEQLIVVTQKLTKELNNKEQERGMLKDEIERINESHNKLLIEKEQNLEDNKKLTNENTELNSNINTLKEKVDSLMIDLKNVKDTDDRKTEENKLCLELNEKNNELTTLKEKLEITISENEHISLTNDQLQRENEELKNELDNTVTDNENTSGELKKALQEKSNLELKLSECNRIVDENNKLILELKRAIEHLENEVERSKSTETKLAEQSGHEILKLAQENKDLRDKNVNLENIVAEWESKFDSKDVFNELEEKVNNLKRDNAELLAEMNEMNQALKERGETISKQQSYCDEVLKKISAYESQANKHDDTISQNNETIKELQDENMQLKNTIQDISESNEKDVEIQQLRSEINILKDRMNNSMDQDSSYAECDTLSTSTISRTDEANRLKDLEGSWEERYGKLRTLAVKQKGKIRELTAELSKEQADKHDNQQKLSSNVKTVQTMQAQCDKLQDEIESIKIEHKSLLKKFENSCNEINTYKKQLTLNDELMSKLKIENETLTKEKSNLDGWKKQVGAKVQSLKKELEANTVLKKDYESRIHKLNQDLESKEKILKEEKEKHLHTRNSLQESNNECKKQSVLNLEMQDYERGIKDMSQKLEKKNELVTKLKNQIDSQKSTVNSVKEQNRLLEERTTSLETELDACKIEVNTFKKSINDLEAVIVDKDSKIQDIMKSVESTRSENEELGTQLSQVMAEQQKVTNSLKAEKDHYKSENLGLEQRLREVEDELKLKEDELNNMRSEYQGYKVRAQSVLRQNQTRDVGMEEKLLEEGASLRAQVDILKVEIDEMKVTVEKITAENEQLLIEKEKVHVAKLALSNEMEESRRENDKLNSRHQQMASEHAETVRSLRVHADTLAQCYRQQISEQEVRHNREIIELQSKLEKGSNPPDYPSLVLPTTPREEGEGSESVDSANGNIHPLEKLLGTDQDHEISLIKKQLGENESKVMHLTALLADTEQDLAKHMQMNKVLKEEIRRQQRSVEREKHAENLEYMKNVVFKFITLNNGDERQRLVPVLNTILKLSPEETQKLNMVAKGDKSWSNYLPLWSSNKPQ